MFIMYLFAITDFSCVVWASVKDDRPDGENPFIIIVCLISMWSNAQSEPGYFYTQLNSYAHTYSQRFL